jgi:hypothetical protein
MSGHRINMHVSNADGLAGAWPSLSVANGNLPLASWYTLQLGSELNAIGIGPLPFAR